jgi:hypothetical protein
MAMAELRQIKTLRLGATRREQVARTAIALEDAMRTASLPRLPQGAILLVRRLNLGRLPADASPQWLSRHIEARLRGLQPAPVRVRQDNLGAPAVWFADRSEALANLLATSLHAGARAWYWAGVLPGWRPGMTVPELLPLALRQAASETTQAQSLAALLDRLLQLACLDQVLRHLDPAHVPSAPDPARTERSSHQERHEASDDEKSREHAVVSTASAPWRGLLTRWLRQWGAADGRSRWLAAHALVAVHGPAAAIHADRLIAQLAGSMPLPRQDRIERPADRPVRPSLQAMPHIPEGARAKGYPRLAAAKPAIGGGQAEAAPAEPGWQPSRHAGLLLVLPALARLEIAEADAEGDLCLCLLHRIADRLRIRKDDPIRQALPKPLPRAQPRSFVAPAAWQGLVLLPRRIDLGREEGLLAACQLVLARYLRRYARISPRRLVRRPALVHATRSHIDLCFDARWVELDVRRTGLDLDPGWVPWLGRVVSFHYDYEGRP